MLREFYPKGMDLSKVDEDELSYYLTIMNDWPRKCIQYKIPKEIMFLTLGVAFNLTNNPYK
ncbi:hypothetical protein [Erysipelatoclostridium sp. AM42-17]|uniref:hypothetical protein n=1 Tax=Erysipelatoclostridium sp. AM42-17 TaxID=2293102 RepID=UPI0018F4E951|nr:hypothetical protein [Erysipelatoclostridium sp. AM42-17]